MKTFHPSSNRVFCRVNLAERKSMSTIGYKVPSNKEYVELAVSVARQTLREVQDQLNRFLWSTELCYGHFLFEPERTFGDLERLTSDALGHVATEAWYPSTHGFIKYNQNVKDMQRIVQENTVHIYRAVTVSFVAAFEQYLDVRMRELGLHREARSWGPYCLSLTNAALIRGNSPLRLKTLLRADVCRVLRNSVAHPSEVLACQRLDSAALKCRALLIKHLNEKIGRKAWPNCNADKEVDDALDFTIGHAEQEQLKALNSGKNLPIELFYAIFTFTNLDALAFELEESTLGPGEIQNGRIFRRRGGVRRNDLIVRSTGITDHNDLIL